MTDLRTPTSTERGTARTLWHRITSRLRLVALLASRGLNRRRAAASLLLLALATATTTLSFAFAVDSAADQPWQYTRGLTKGPDVWVRAEQRTDQRADLPEVLAELAGAPGVVEAGRPYPCLRLTDLRGPHGTVAALVEVRDSPDATVDRPALTSGTWAVAGAVVVERAFADALGVRPGDELQLAGRRLSVAGVAVTTSRSPYPTNTPGLLWMSTSDSGWLQAAATDRYTAIALRLADPATAPRFAAAIANRDRSVLAQPWQATHEWTISDQRWARDALLMGAWVLALLAVAGAAVLAGGRMADQRRRIGLLKAVGATPRMIGAVLMTEHLVIAAAAAALGLVVGRLAAAAIAQPSVGLADRPLSPTISPTAAFTVVAMALILTCAATLPTAWTAARSTVAALSVGVRAPRRHPRLVALSRRLPVSGLIGLRLAGRRPRRALLSTLSLTVTVAMVVAALSMRYYTDHRGARTPTGIDFVPGAGNPVVDRVDRATLAVVIALLALAAMNTLLIGWASVLDFRRGTALLRALGADARQVTAGIVVASLIPGVVAGFVGIPVGLAVFTLSTRIVGLRHEAVLPPMLWLSPVPFGTVAVVALLMLWPARAGAHHPVAQTLASE